MTKRQWVILQAGLPALDEIRQADQSGGWSKVVYKWNDEDGKPPTQAEIDKTAELVGNMRYDPDPPATKRRGNRGRNKKPDGTAPPAGDR